jgi:glycerol uptake facilitator protein
LRQLKFIQCLFYIAGQLVGAFLGAFVVYVLYISELNMYDGGIRQIEGANATADIFYTAPSRGVPNWNCLIDQIISTSLLHIFIMALSNDYNYMISNTAKPFAFVLMITAIGSGMNLNCGYPLNPVCLLAFDDIYK